MDDLRFDHGAMRAHVARLGVLLHGVVVLLPWLALSIILGGVVLLVVLGWSLGWLLVGMSVIPAMLFVFQRRYIDHLPAGKGDDIASIVAGDVLGRLPLKPTPQSVAEATAHTNSGQFMAVRFGLSPSLVASLASDNPATMPELWKLAHDIRERNGVPQISGSVLVVAIVRSFPTYESVLAQIHLDDEDLDRGIQWQQHLTELVEKHSKPRRTGGIARDWSFGWIPLLTRFGQNISEQMSGNRALLTVDTPGHSETIDQLVDTFGSGGRQNAVLVGETGAGKTTVIHAFAERLLDAEAKVPESLRFRQVFILDSAALISAAPGRGELENLIVQVLNEAYRAKNIIICLDNAQLFFEEGVGAVDLSNVLQPILEAGNLRVILSMDEQRYLAIGRRNPELVNAVNRINVSGTSQTDTMAIMQEQLIMYEIQRHVTYMYQALKEAYRLSERYVHDLAMPGRSLKLLESAAGFSESGLVTMNSVQQAIEKTLDVKVSVATDSDDRARLLGMEDLIHKRMVNQTRAVSVVSDALRRARAGVRNPNRPIGTFLFLGPTGVGKTELSKALADVYFGGEGKMIRLDLNEYVQASDVARLIADGADDPSSLTAQVMKQPFSVVLLDEIEKAAPEVLTTLLQLLDEGILRDVKNREVSFRDAIVIATSNAGADRIREYIERGYDVEQFEQQFIDELISSNQFRPEFLNRFDEIVVFRPFKRDELVQVLDLILASVNKTLEPQKVSVTVDDEAKQILVDKGYDPRLGARPMRRVVQKAVENTVAKQMLSGQVNPGDTIHISADQVQQIFTTHDTVQRLAEPPAQ
ncbi:MAG: ATP-dependent Clp protease ATP-binding subunit [Candidatus Saccharimonas sp.]